MANTKSNKELSSKSEKPSSSKLGRDPLEWITQSELTLPQTQLVTPEQSTSLPPDPDKPPIIPLTTNSSQKGLPEQWTRATFIIDKKILEQVKDCAYTDRRTIRDVVHDALVQYLNGRELLSRKQPNEKPYLL